MPEIFTKFSSHIVKHGMSFREQFTPFIRLAKPFLHVSNSYFHLFPLAYLFIRLLPTFYITYSA